jgi:hypothetical protein
MGNTVPPGTDNMKTKMISIAKDFSENPAGRYISDGPNSGQRFRDEILIPALKNFEKVQIDLDGALGFGSSFLEETFGGLVRNGFKGSDLHDRIEICSSLQVYKDRVWRYIDEEATRMASKS